RRRSAIEPDLFVQSGIGSDSREFADAIYDIQKMLGIKADGMAVPRTTKAFYERNKQPRDKAYECRQTGRARGAGQGRRGGRRRETKGDGGAAQGREGPSGPERALPLG